MKSLVMVFRGAALLALLLGLSFLFGLGLPRWTVDIHVLLGIIVVLCALVLGWQLRSTPGITGMVLALVVFVLGLGFRLGWWGGLTLGLVHLAAAVAMIGAIEAAA